MVPVEVQLKSGRATLRVARESDIDELVELNRLCFPTMIEESVVWSRGQLRNHLRLFPEGQLLVEREGRILGAVSTLVVHLGIDPYRRHTYAGITDGGFFHNHDPEGDTLYGADVYVHPDERGSGVAGVLYEARRALCVRLNLERILAGGRLFGYHEVSAKMTPEQYVEAVVEGRLWDPVLGFQLRKGFVVRALLPNYVRDPQSEHFAALIEWKNPDYVPHPSGEARKIRVAAVQYQMRRVASFDDFAEQVAYFVDTAAEYRADFVVFPEFSSVQLLSQRGLSSLSSLEGVRRLTELEGEVFGLFSGLAQRRGLTVIGGSHPIARDGKIFNVSPVFLPDGDVFLQPKLHITPSEREAWGISGGHELRVLVTPKAKIGVLVCYDSEFPEAARHLADEGCEVLFVPYCTDNREGHLRVRYCCQARAIENQMYVVAAGVVGNLPSVPAMDVHYAQSAVYTPSDFEFARDAIQAQTEANVESLLVTDLDITDLYRNRASGSVRPRLDRRKDLFEYRAHFAGAEGESLPMQLAPDRG